MNGGHPVFRAATSAISSWICWTGDDPFVVGGSGEVQYFPLAGVTQGRRRREAAYGSRLQHMSWDGWLGRMAQSRCRKVVDTASRPVPAQQPHPGVSRPSRAGAYRFRGWRYGPVRKPRWRGAVGAHWRQWGSANDLVADHRPG